MSAAHVPTLTARKISNIVLIGPDKDLACSIQNPECLKKPGLTVIGDGKKSINPEDILSLSFDRNPTIYISAHGGMVRGQHHLQMRETPPKTLPAEDVLLGLSQKLGQDSEAVIVLGTCKIGEDFLRKAAKFLPPKVTLVTTAKEGFQGFTMSADPITDLVFKTHAEILAETLVNHGIGASVLRGGRIVSASPPKTLLSHAEMHDHLQTEFVRFGLDPSLVTDDLTTAYGLGMIQERYFSNSFTDEFLESIASSGINVNSKGRDGRNNDLMLSLTKYVVHKDSPTLPLMRALLASNFDFNAPIYSAGSYGGEYVSTLLHFLAQYEDISILDALLTAKVDLDQTVASSGATALRLASAEGILRTVDKLIAAGADVDKSDNAGRTPLGVACINKFPGIVKSLLEAGAQKDLKQAFDFAVAQPDREEAKALILLCLDNGFRPENPPKYRKFIDDHLKKKDALAKESAMGTSEEFVVDARGGVAAPAPKLPRSATASIAATPAAASAAAPPPPARITSAASAAPGSSALTATPQSVSTTASPSAGIAAASLFAVTQAFVASKFPAASTLPEATLFDPSAPLPEVSAGFTPSVVHQTEAERKFALEQKLERRARDAETASKQPSPKPHHASSKPAKGKPGTQGHR